MDPWYLVVTGHRPNKLGGYGPSAIQDRVRLWLRDEIVRASAEVEPDHLLIGISGMALGVDQWFAEECIKMAVPFIAAIPFLGQERRWPEISQEHYHDLLKRAVDHHIVCDGSYAGWKMQRRNEYMVDRGNRLLAVWDGTSGGTANCVNYAEKANREIVRIPLELLHG